MYALLQFVGYGVQEVLENRTRECYPARRDGRQLDGTPEEFQTVATTQGGCRLHGLSRTECLV
jgi:hypothetical protein